LNVLQSIEDVTTRVTGAVKAGATDAEAFAARRAEISAIEAGVDESTGLRSDVDTLYQGGQYNLYRYKKYTDVRLVFVPEFRLRSSAAILTTSTFRASTSTWPSCVFTKTVSQ
jgi:hypothetical protein